MYKYYTLYTESMILSRAIRADCATCKSNARSVCICTIENNRDCRARVTAKPVCHPEPALYSRLLFYATHAHTHTRTSHLFAKLYMRCKPVPVVYTRRPNEQSVRFCILPLGALIILSSSNRGSCVLFHFFSSFFLSHFLCKRLSKTFNFYIVL